MQIYYTFSSHSVYNLNISLILYILVVPKRILILFVARHKTYSPSSHNSSTRCATLAILSCSSWAQEDQAEIPFSQPILFATNVCLNSGIACVSLQEYLVNVYWKLNFLVSFFKLLKVLKNRSLKIRNCWVFVTQYTSNIFIRNNAFNQDAAIS